MTNLYSDIHARLIETPSRVILHDRHDGQDHTASQLIELTGQFAAQLRALDLKKGDRICAQVDKSLGNIALYLASLQLGLIYQPINNSYTDSEVAFFLADAKPRLFVCTPARFDSLRLVASKNDIQCRAMPANACEDGLWKAALTQEPYLEIAPIKDGELAALIYTSGTTGRSKGAMLSHHALKFNALALIEHWGLQNNDCLIHALPLFHVHGLFIALNTALLAGSKILLFDKFSPGMIIPGLSNATLMMGVPTMYARLLEHDDFNRNAIKNIRVFISGSAPMTVTLHQAFHAKTGQHVLERYGMSEAGIISSEPLNGRRQPGSVGFSLKGQSIRIADEKGRKLSPGKIGMIEIKGPNLFEGYWGLAEKTSEEMTEDGWFKTGDQGVMDQEGRLKIVGREKDLIISGGYNIYPIEIEQLLDAIDGVKESAVIGVPHSDMGEGVAAILIADGPKISVDDIQKILDKELARFKHPRKFFWLDALPRNAMGKVQKQRLREDFSEAFKP